ncbi:MAG: protein translocase subunit SecD [Leptospiraceae bacterium]|nr:protein translocase subunit SecD [Leptospiraceae bacterium]MDW7975588.1 protein translocase subunit SecD [Leptospiraceae bacterium]
MKKIIGKAIVFFGVLVLSFFLLLPNYDVREIEIHFLDYYRTKEGEKVLITEEQIKEFLESDKGMKQFFPDFVCKESDPIKERKCTIKQRFLTTTKLNEFMQAFPNLVDNRKTRYLPHFVENLLGFLSETGVKKLSLKFGLDLQGGMRAVFRADYQAYVEKLKDKYQPILEDLEKQLKQPNLTEKEKEDIQSRIENINLSFDLSESRKIELLEEARSIIEKRLLNQNLTEPEIRTQPSSYSINVDLPGVANTAEVLDIIKSTVTVEYRLVNDEATERLNTLEFLPYLEKLQEIYKQDRPDFFEAERILKEVQQKANITEKDGKIFLYWRKSRTGQGKYLPYEFRVLGPVVLDGSDMADAREAIQENTAWYQINFVLTSTGAEKFAKITRENVGKRLAILWGDRVISDPVIQGAIVGGSGVITGQFDLQDAREIANVIREGALPLPLEIISVSYIGPTLGYQSIKTGVVAVLIGFLLVNAFMIFYYQVAGVIAVIVLFYNLILLSSFLTMLEFTLTLPGFAGLILTVGMAVDASVIIFERIREELRNGRSMTYSVEAGFKDSFWTILDANITTLIAAVILYYTGDGPIQGFAITLFFGLLTSLFTSLYIAKFLFEFLLYGLRWKKIPIGSVRGLRFGVKK